MAVGQKLLNAPFECLEKSWLVKQNYEGMKPKMKKYEVCSLAIPKVMLEIKNVKMQTG